MERLGRVGLIALGVMVVSDLVAYHAEHATNSEFATFGDALWWGIVTLTTVGYGDIVPVDPFARSLANLEAIIGQFYLAMTVARLVTLEVGKQRL